MLKTILCPLAHEQPFGFLLSALFDFIESPDDGVMIITQTYSFRQPDSSIKTGCMHSCVIWKHTAR
jgi:hypothetical protein